MTDSFIREDDWEFNAPRFCDFDRMGMNMSRTDQWFETSEAAQLETIEAEIMKKRSRDQQQQQSKRNQTRIKSPMFTPIRTPKKNTHREKQNTTSTTATATAAIPFKNNPASTRLKLTIPRTPKFRTEQRLRATTNNAAVIDENWELQQQQKRNNKKQQQQQQQHWEPKLTQPVPFRFHESTKSNLLNNNETFRSPFKSNSERIKEFEKNCRESRKQLHQMKPTITIPKEFHLSTSTRQHHHHTVLSTEERERLEIENAPKFKARPLNPKLFQNSGAVVVTAQKKLPLTKPEGFRLHTELRAASNNNNNNNKQKMIPAGRKRPRSIEAEEEDKEEYNNNKKPSKIQKKNDTTTDDHTCPPKLTVPESPSLATKMRHRPVVIPEPEPIPAFKARPMPTHIIQHPFKPKLGDAPLTEPEPFPLKTEKRGQMHVETLKEKLERERRELEEKRTFKAKPVTIHVNTGLSKVEKLPLTEPEPFNLAGELIHQIAKERFQEKVKEEEIKLKMAANSFKARPMPDDKPFVPQKLNLPLTEPIEAPLKSELRAEERRRFDEAQKQKEMEMEAERKRMEEERKKQEELEMMRLRREMEVKAKPMPEFYRRAATSTTTTATKTTIKKPVSIHEKRERKNKTRRVVEQQQQPFQPKLTIPQEFRFQTSERSRVRSMMNH